MRAVDVALRDERILGRSRDEVPAYALDGKRGHERQLAEQALDRTLIDMVTRNPALTLRWYDKGRSIEAGKTADLLLIRQPPSRRRSACRRRSTRPDRRQRTRGGARACRRPLAGHVELMGALKPGDCETVTSAAGGFQKAVDVTDQAGPRGRRDARPDQRQARGGRHRARRRQPARRWRPRATDEHLQLPEGARRRWRSRRSPRSPLPRLAGGERRCAPRRLAQPRTPPTLVISRVACCPRRLSWRVGAGRGTSESA